MNRIETAQSILNSICDIRPQYRGRRVVTVEEVNEEDGKPVPVSTVLHLDDETTVKLTGLYAKRILSAKDDHPAKGLVVELDGDDNG